MKIDKIVFATGNEGKMKEIRMIMADLGIAIQSMKEAEVDVTIIEDGETFEENAMIKAKTIAQALKDMGEQAVVLADDSGLEIDYLNKEPGIYSARYMGEDTSYTIKNANLIQRLEGVPDEKRTARFVCAIAAVFTDGRSFETRSTIEGRIGYEERGENGFGYDPIFYLPEYRMYSAELAPEEKNRISDYNGGADPFGGTVRSRLRKKESGKRKSDHLQLRRIYGPRRDPAVYGGDGNRNQI